MHFYRQQRLTANVSSDFLSGCALWIGCHDRPPVNDQLMVTDAIHDRAYLTHTRRYITDRPDDRASLRHSDQVLSRERPANRKYATS